MVESVFVEEMLECTIKCYYHADFVRYNWVLVVIITKKICPLNDLNRVLHNEFDCNLYRQ